jgi:hypothetical protein
MLETIRRWLPRRGGERYPELAQWAAARRCSYKARADGGGVLIESTVPEDAWRLEWGPSQRPYIAGHELRLRAVLGADDVLQLVVLTRQLMQSLETDIFEQYTEDLRTRADTATPDEMRWLVLYPKLAASELGVLRDHFGAAGHPKAALMDWLAGDLSDALAMAATGWLRADMPLALVVQRGRLTMRVPLAKPNAAACDDALALFRVAAREARAVHDRWAGSGATPSTQPALWARAGGDDGGAPR